MLVFDLVWPSRYLDQCVYRDQAINA